MTPDDADRVLELMLVVTAGVLGSVIASYLGVVAERGWRGSAAGRSVCVCGRTLAWWENVPVLSWILLRGRCRCRETAIPPRYVITELTLAAACSAAAFAAGVLGAAVALVVGARLVLALSRKRARRSGPACIRPGSCDNCDCTAHAARS